MALPSAERVAIKNSFGSHDAYIAWLTAAKKEYEDSQNRIEIGGDGSVDLGDLTGGSN